MFNTMNTAPSLSDIAAVTGNNDGFGGGNGWWVLIILFAIFGGWGNRGGTGTSQAIPTVSDVQRGFDQQTLIGKIDGQTYGIADLGYAVTNSFAQAELSRANQQAALMAQLTQSDIANLQSSNAIQGAIKDCCCQNREATAQARYDSATNTCAITTAIANAVQTIVQNDNNNYRQLHDENVAIQMNAKNDKIAELTALLNNANLAASQARQNEYLIGRLQPTPYPAYVVPNPFTGTPAAAA